jgi:DNA gyrase/topoisomerase IV subunit B
MFPVKGKLLNVRKISHKEIMENAEINNVNCILGPQHGKLDYDYTKDLVLCPPHDHDELYFTLSLT